VLLGNVQAAFLSQETSFRVRYLLSVRRSVAAPSQFRYLTEGEDIPTIFYSPHCSSFADLFFRPATQRTQSVFIGMVGKEPIVVGDQSADNMPATGSAVSGVLDRVRLCGSAKRRISVRTCM
jgi:hypothetical protein